MAAQPGDSPALSVLSDIVLPSARNAQAQSLACQPPIVIITPRGTCLYPLRCVSARHARRSRLQRKIRTRRFPVKIASDCVLPSLRLCAFARDLFFETKLRLEEVLMQGRPPLRRDGGPSKG